MFAAKNFGGVIKGFSGFVYPFGGEILIYSLLYSFMFFPLLLVLFN